jgi:hypothetical protein
MNIFESIALIIAFFFSIVAYLSHRKLKKRFDVVEQMLARKEVLSYNETKWENLPSDVKKAVTEQNQGL